MYGIGRQFAEAAVQIEIRRQRHLRGEKEKFGCLGGHKYFYLDWHLNLYRCHFWETPMCNIYQFDFYINRDEAFRQVEGTIYWLGVKYTSGPNDGFTFGVQMEAWW